GQVTLQPDQDEGGRYFARFEPRAFVPHPGSHYFKLYLVNRVTGYMGSAMLKLVNRSGADTTATPAGGPTEGMVTLAPFIRIAGKEYVAVAAGRDPEWDMPLRPPNIKVTATRQND